MSASDIQRAIFAKNDPAYYSKIVLMQYAPNHWLYAGATAENTIQMVAQRSQNHTEMFEPLTTKTIIVKSENVKQLPTPYTFSTKSKAFRRQLSKRFKPTDEIELRKSVVRFLEEILEADSDFKDTWRSLYDDQPMPENTSHTRRELAQSSVDYWDLDMCSEFWQMRFEDNINDISAFLQGLYGDLEADETPKSIATLMAYNIEPTHLMHPLWGNPSLTLEEARKLLTAWLRSTYESDPDLCLYHAGTMRR